MKLRLIIFSLCLMLGCWASTLLLVAKLSPIDLPKGAWFSLGEITIFAPWQWPVWFFQYGDKAKDLFFITMWPIYVGIALGVLLARIASFYQRKAKASQAHGSARWAFENEIKKAGLLNPNGIVLGKILQGNDLIGHNGPEHTLVVAPTRGGKGVGIVIPTLLNWQESAVILDPKGENWHYTSGYRATFSDCFYFDPTSKVGMSFNPLSEIRIGEYEVKDTQNIADILVDPDGKSESRNHWQNAAHSLLVGTILFVVYYWPKKSLAGVLEFLSQPNKPFVATLEEMRNSSHQIVSSIAQEMLNKHDEERSGVLSTAVSLLTLFRDPLIASATDSHDVAIVSLRQSKKPISLYVVLPPSDISRLRVLIRIILNQLGRTLTESLPSSSLNTNRILFLLDEFPILGRLEFFESALAYMAGYGLKSLLICQSLNQLEKVYGAKNSILDNCHIRVIFANNDDETARKISHLLGEATMLKEQMSLSGNRLDVALKNTSVSHLEYGRPLLFPSEINRLPNDQEIILINSFQPILAKKVRYFDDNHFKQRVLLPLVPKARIKIATISENLSPVLPPIGETTPYIGSAL